MDLIIDANIVFASLIKLSTTAEIILNENFHLFAPEYLFDEIQKYENYILDKTKRSKDEFYAFFEMLKDIITIIPVEEFKKYIKKAEEITPDIKDIYYLALALRLHCPFWSNDTKLNKQKLVKIYSTKEILSLI